MVETRLRTIEEFLALFSRVKPVGQNQWQALCPAHSDHEPSLNIKLADHKILVHCLAGCLPNAIVQAVGLTMAHLYLDNTRGSRTQREIVCTYPYHDAAGAILFEVVRFKPKSFSQRRPDGTWGLRGVTPVIYHLPEVIKAIAAGATILVAEGEKDADNLRAMGFIATTNPMGSLKWRPSYTDSLTGAKQVVIFADNDAPGRKHARQVAQSLYDAGVPAKVIEMPDSTIKDVSDWINAGLTRDKLLETITATPPWEPSTSTLTLDDGVPITYNLTDLGNSERLASQNQGKVRYCWDTGKWLIWTGKVWQCDEGPKIKVIAKRTARNIYHEAAEAGSPEEAEKIAKHAHASESEARLSAMVTLAQSEAGIPVRLSDLNVNPWLLNTQNGTVDLKTGKLLPHNAADLITLQVPVDYTPSAECPTWLKFLDLVTECDVGLQVYLQKAVGYSLTGNTGAQVLFLLYGLGQNGKGTFTSTIRNLLAGYACKLDAEDLMLADRHQRSGPKEGIADLQGARFAVGSEIQDGRQLNTSLVKDISGQDSVKARRLYAHEVEFIPQCKLWLYGNHRPVIKDTTLSIWRRVKLIPFTATIPEPERIDDYAERYLRPEWPGILAWAVRGCLLWQSDGLKDTESVKSATARYRADEDILGDFITDCCILETGATITKAELRTLYQSWCEGSKTDAVTQKTFKSHLVEKGITDGFNPAKTHRVWGGIRKRTPMDDLSDTSENTVSDKNCPNLALDGQEKHDFPKLSLVNTTRKGTLQQNLSEMSVLSEKAGELPDCPKCGRNEWTYSPEGGLVCPCGYKEVGNDR